MTKRDLVYFFKISILIFILSLVLDRVVYFSLNQISDRVYTGQGIGKLNHFLKIKDDKDVIVFGSSRANRHFVTEELSANGYNMGADGRKIAYPATLILTLPKDKKQLVLFNLDVSYVLDSTYTGNDMDALSTKYGRTSIITENLEKTNQVNFFQRIYKSLGYNGYIVGTLYNYISPRYDYKNYDGYDPNFLSEDQKMHLRVLVKNHTPGKCNDNPQINRITQTYFNEVAKFCKENNKDLVFVISPVYFNDCPILNQFVREFMENHEYVLLDYSDFFDANNSLDYWKDLSHLSDKGAKLFSEQLKKDLVLLGYSKP